MATSSWLERPDRHSRIGKVIGSTPISSTNRKTALKAVFLRLWKFFRYTFFIPPASTATTSANQHSCRKINNKIELVQKIRLIGAVAEENVLLS